MTLRKAALKVLSVITYVRHPTFEQAVRYYIRDNYYSTAGDRENPLSTGAPATDPPAPCGPAVAGGDLKKVVAWGSDQRTVGVPEARLQRGQAAANPGKAFYL